MKAYSGLRAAAKNVPWLYWLAGLASYTRFRRHLGRENRAYLRGSRKDVPPPILRYRVHRAFDEASYTRNGQVIARCLADAFSANGVVLDDIDILDFACGPGRVIREFSRLSTKCRLHGSDIDKEAIGWAQEHLSQVASFSTNTAEAPTGFANDTFDAIYCVSLFTHLDEPAQYEWLAEMARILKPGGLFVTTTHGRHTLGSCTASELADLQRDGIVYRVDRKGRFKVDGLPDFYQTTFHTRDYVQARWGALLPIVEHLEGGLNGHQDIVVMRKPEVGATITA